MKTIVSISVDYTNARKTCELIENQTYSSYNDLRDFLNKELDVKEDDENQPQFFDLTDFMDECNDQLFDFENTFLSYVDITN